RARHRDHARMARISGTDAGDVSANRVTGAARVEDPAGAAVAEVGVAVEAAPDAIERGADAFGAGDVHGPADEVRPGARLADEALAAEVDERALGAGADQRV